MALSLCRAPRPPGCCSTRPSAAAACGIERERLSVPGRGPAPTLRRSRPCVVQKTLWAFSGDTVSPVPPHPAPRHPLQAEWRTKSWVTHCLTTSSSSTIENSQSPAVTAAVTDLAIGIASLCDRPLACRLHVTWQRGHVMTIILTGDVARGLRFAAGTSQHLLAQSCAVAAAASPALHSSAPSF